MIKYSILHTICNEFRTCNVRRTETSIRRKKEKGQRTKTTGFGERIRRQWCKWIRGTSKPENLFHKGNEFTMQFVLRKILTCKKSARTGSRFPWKKKEGLEQVLLFFLFLMVFSSIFATLDGGLYASHTCIEYGDHDARCLEALRLSN